LYIFLGFIQCIPVLDVELLLDGDADLLHGVQRGLQLFEVLILLPDYLL
jgi:hypothetical protein